MPADGTVRAFSILQLSFWIKSFHTQIWIGFYLSVIWQTTYMQTPKFSSVQLLSRIWLFAIPQTAARPASLSITNYRSLLKFMPVESVTPSNHLNPCRPLLPPSIFPSIRVFSNESVLRIRWPKYWSFSISPSSEYSGLISFRIDWLDLLAVQGTFKSLHLKASIL